MYKNYNVVSLLRLVQKRIRDFTKARSQRGDKVMTDPIPIQIKFKDGETGVPISQDGLQLAKPASINSVLGPKNGEYHNGLDIPSTKICWPESLPKPIERAKKLTESNTPARHIDNGTESPKQTLPRVKTFADMAEILGPIVWEWPSWLAKGFLSLLISESGVGKSMLLMRLCGCYLLGWPWPDGTPFTGETGAVMWCEAEASQALNLERATSWGYPLDRIYVPLDDTLEDFNIDDPKHKEALKEKVFLPEVRFIVIDSLRGLHKGDENSSEVNTKVKWFAELARDSQKLLILSHHLNKKSFLDGNVVTLDRARGSSAIVQTPRLVWALDVPDQKDKDNKRLMVVKSNLDKYPDPVGMTINENGVIFGDAPEPPKVETQKDKAKDLLLSLLANDPMKVDAIEKAFKAIEISWRTANKAKKELGINTVRKGGTNGYWVWSLPPKDEIKGGR